ncbi:MAG: sulfatase [Armatimonadetes bacterium]|nr:sulfatase [Armatimonadota bacterium]
MAERLNLIVMVAHDLGRFIGPYGLKTVATPHLDRLAAEGARFSRSFCVAPQCSPSRASIFTGRYPHNNGVLGLCHGLFKWDLHPEEQHFAGLLQQGGYHTALVGLQHETTRPDAMGYDEIVAPNAPCDYQGEQRAERFGAQAAELLARLAGGEQPFFIQMGFFEPHRLPGSPNLFGPMAPAAERGVTVPPYLVDDDSARAEVAAFQGAVQVMDAGVGRVLEALDGLGLAENTLVLFTTDHGIPFPRAKCSVYDPGLETCLLLRGPLPGLRGGQVYDPMLPHIDLLPTLLDLLGLPTPAAVQGRTVAPLLRGDHYQPRAEIFGEMTYHDYYDPVRCIRTETHKLIVAFMFNRPFMDPSQAWRPGTITVVPDDPMNQRHDLVELYDLRNDPLEHHNLAHEPAQAALRDELLARLYRHMAATEDPLLTGVPPSPMHLDAVRTLKEAAERAE